ncbi:g4369 [Coccomyxa elongata]
MLGSGTSLLSLPLGISGQRSKSCCTQTLTENPSEGQSRDMAGSMNRKSSRGCKEPTTTLGFVIINFVPSWFCGGWTWP